MANADVSIDEARAKAWVGEVKTKLKEVDRTLEKVENIRNTMVGSDDTIFKMMEKVSYKMKEVWKATQTSFQKGWSALEDGLDAYKKAGNVIQSAFDELEKKV